VLRRFAEYHDLEGAFGRRALTERAKGILMERHAIDEEQRLRPAARALPRQQPQLIDLATAVVDGHQLLPNNRTLLPRPDAKPRSARAAQRLEPLGAAVALGYRYLETDARDSDGVVGAASPAGRRFRLQPSRATRRLRARPPGCRRWWPCAAG
jgi:hypothetical protein